MCINKWNEDRAKKIKGLWSDSSIFQCVICAYWYKETCHKKIDREKEQLPQKIFLLLHNGYVAKIVGPIIS
jgi:hypothetical protein